MRKTLRFQIFQAVPSYWRSSRAFGGIDGKVKRRGWLKYAGRKKC